MQTQKLKEFLLQSFLIFLSVFLGITAGNWNESRKEKKRVEFFLKSFLEEVKFNQVKIQKAYPYHKKIGTIGDSLLRALPEESRSATLMEMGGMDGEIKDWKGIQTVIIDKAVYESGLNSGVFEHLELPLLLRMTRVHSFEELYLDFSKTILDGILDLKTDSKFSDFLSSMATLKTDVYGMEIHLDREYKYLIEALEKAIQ